jgi:hypothetical protein
MIRGITREQVLEAARAFIDADRLVIATAGP